MKILVLGAGGMAGHVVATHLRACGHDVDTLTASNPLDDDTMLVDVTDQRAFEAALSSGSWDVVINCIGILVKESDVRPDLAAYLNGYLPHYLERRYRNTATRFIHLSTDCVFSGEHGPYSEDSPYDGQLFYDRSKALGEFRSEKDLTFRQSIIGPDSKVAGTGLFNWYFAQTGEISGWTNAIWSGVTTIELAKGMQAAIEQNLTGLYHLVPNGSISKYDLLVLFGDVFGRDDVTVDADERSAPDKTLINTRTDFAYEVPDYRTMVEEMRDWIERHPELYPHYVRAGVA